MTRVGDLKYEQGRAFIARAVHNEWVEWDELPLVREEYPFGRAETFRVPDGRLFYRYQGCWWSWDRLRDVLAVDWRPVAHDDLRWKCENVDR